ncbi:MAG: NAD(+)/NADH kinase [Oscillospiraceae bacterium]|nr:NAD(+)/NADH kinase [Oscillospiraceae bacterium]
MIAICTNPYRDAELNLTFRVKEILSGLGYESCVCPVFANPEEMTEGELPVELFHIRDVLPALTHAVVLGGDGTILAVVRQILGTQIPILGVNLGTKGFMTALETDELDRIPEAFREDAKISTRMMLRISLLREGESIISDCALNDVVIHGYGECISPTAWADGNKMFSFSGDGLIIATPTGSTGYSMSAGGPIVEPDARAILLTPICAHTLTAKPYVLPPDRRVRVLTEKLTGRRAYLAVDGYPVADLESGDLLEIETAGETVRMIELSSRSFYEQLEKLV